jgi:hypothetical protein
VVADIGLRRIIVEGLAGLLALREKLQDDVAADRLERFLATTETPQSAETKGDDHER